MTLQLTLVRFSPRALRTVCLLRHSNLPVNCCSYHERRSAWKDPRLRNLGQFRGRAAFGSREEFHWIICPDLYAVEYGLSVPTANGTPYALTGQMGYTPDGIRKWADTIARETASCRDVFVYFKHEEEGKGPEFARLLMDRLGLRVFTGPA